MDVAVIVPWRAGCPRREAAWRWLRHQWETAYPGWEVVEGTCPAGPWVKAHAVADALSRTSAELIILADADVWTEGVEAAVDVVLASGGWAIPHWRVHRLDQVATKLVLLGGSWFHEGLDCDRRPYVGYAGGGMTVIERGLLERAPLDPRFVGWGQEDQAAAAAWVTLDGKPWRGKDPLWHLWHPPQPDRPARVERATGLLLRYQEATGTPERMRALLAESRGG